MRYLSNFQELVLLIQSKLHLRRILHNSFWLISEKIFTMIVGLYVVSLTVRYFGPEKYGEFNYALAFISVFTSLSNLGLESISIRAFIEKKFSEEVILITSIILRLSSSLIVLFASNFLIFILNKDDFEIRIMVAILSLSILFRSIDIIDYWIQANQRNKLSTIVKVSVYIIFSLLKILLIIFGGDIILFSLINTINVILIEIGLIIVYLRNHQGNVMYKFDTKYAKDALSKSFPIILVGMITEIYSQMDKLMLGILLPTKYELGIYSSALQVSAMWYFIPIAVIMAFQPFLFDLRQKNITRFDYYLKLLYSINIWIGLLAGITAILTAKFIIIILFGSEYIAAAEILTISIWSGTLAMLTTVRNIWMVSYDIQKYNIIFVVFGAFVNAMLNYLFIPIHGSQGAALATLISQITTLFVIPLFYKNTNKSIIDILKW